MVRRGEIRGLGSPVAACVLVATLLIGAGVAEAAKPRFQEQKLPFNSTRLFDLSVADVDQDSDLDLFSVNHKYRGSLLLSDGFGGFADDLDRSGLSATAQIPHFDDLFRTPTIGANGLYMWVDRDGVTHIRTKGLGSSPALPSTVSGTLRFPLRANDVERIDATGATATKKVDNSTSPPTAEINFKAEANSSIDIRVRFMDLPFEVSIDPEFPRSRVLLGPDLSHPPRSDFKIDLGDRHGVAWADFNGDDITDAYITNGGLRGAVKNLGTIAADELYLGNGDGTFTEDHASIGVNKGLCRGRYVAPVDYDIDGDLDILVGCEGTGPQLFRQRAPGRFGEQSSKLQAPLRVRGDLIRWLNLNDDGPPELITVNDKRVFVFAYDPASDTFSKQQRLRTPNFGKKGDAITPADFDGDGDIDIFIGSKGGNEMLVNKGAAKGGKLKVALPRKFGLPNRGTIAASFVDYDNDGQLDFHSVPHGLFERVGGRKYLKTDEVNVGGKAIFAVSQWFDYDSDGDRDLISALKRKGQTLRKRALRNSTQDGNWLELDLRGPAGNRQAIGTKVVVSTADGEQTGFVGQNEGSRFSSGHYRLYFGLDDSQAAELTVHWPDGSTSRQTVRANQQIEVDFDS